jgi:phosphoribosylaminoimidazole carboxylase
LGKMLVEAANPLNIKVITLDEAHCPASLINRNHMNGSFRNKEFVSKLVEQCNILSFEIEHVDINVVNQCKTNSIQIHPSPSTIELIQDKYQQKIFFKNLGIPVASFREVCKTTDIDSAIIDLGLPLMVKSKAFAYDGKGNYLLKTHGEISQAFSTLKSKDLYVEKCIKFQKELAVIVCKSINGKVSTYPVFETIHQNSVCAVVIAPAQISHLVWEAAVDVATRAVNALSGAGVYAVELFALENGTVLLNEIAPRPHNSGHLTIESCYTSQYENHLRAICGLPLGCTALKVDAAIMINILGKSTNIQEPFSYIRKALSIDGSSVHWYNKTECRPGRKMGHITLIGHPLNKLMKIADEMTENWTEPIIFPISNPVVGIIMGSDSDLPIMKAAALVLKDFEIPFEVTIVSAHRTPERMFQYAKTAHLRGLKVIIAAAGGAAHLPGMVASLTPLPVIGVPIALSHMDGMDSLYSIVQMPRGVPVATGITIYF